MNIQLQHFSDSAELVLQVLFPATYLVHIAEEYFCADGFSEHLRQHYGIELSRARFLTLQLFGLLSMVIGLVLSANAHFPKTMLVILASIVLSNGAIHCVRSIARNCYEPGLVSGVTLWIPLGISTFFLVARGMTPARITLALAIGLGISCIVELTTVRGGKLMNS